MNKSSGYAFKASQILKMGQGAPVTWARYWGTGLGLGLDFRCVLRMKAEHHINDLLGIGRGPEDFALVVLERLDRVGDVAGVLRDVPYPIRGRSASRKR